LLGQEIKMNLTKAAIKGVALATVAAALSATAGIVQARMGNDPGQPYNSECTGMRNWKAGCKLAGGGLDTRRENSQKSGAEKSLRRR
jgi:hypothetical protein